MIRRRNKIRFTTLNGVNVIFLLFSTSISIAGAELVLRFMGHQPWRTQNNSFFLVEPGGTWVIKHHTLGYTHRPGEFRITFRDGYSFKVTHLSNTLRVTHPRETSDSGRQKDEIWIFGCSFTHGWSLNDEETYPWLLQNEFPEYEIVNFGVGGYGTLQSLIQFQEALEQKKPKLVIIAYAAFHDQRNVFLRQWRKKIAILPTLRAFPTYPYARISKDGDLISGMAEIEYSEFPFMRHLALVNLIEETYNRRVEDRLYSSHKVSKAIIRKFSHLAKENGVEIVVAGIGKDSLTRSMLEHSRGEGIMVTDMSVDLSIPGNRNAPHDNHPSAAANIQYARKLATFLRERLNY
jgi:hypothetical protein